MPSNSGLSHVRHGLALLALVLLSACQGPEPEAAGKHPSDTAAMVPPTPPAKHTTPWPEAQPPLRATHWFGDHWAKNLINAYRREDVARDFQQIRDDGFDTVILLASWADFQPVYLPCCQNDPRAFARLRFLIDEAERHGLRVIVRAGYAWGFHPESPPTLERVHVLMNDARARASFHRFIGQLADELRGRPHVLMSFMSWEDQWLRHIEPIAAADYARFVAQLPAAERPTDPTRLPRADDETASWFHRYWDWLAIAELHAPAQRLIGNLGYEVRVDKEPQWTVDAQGDRRVSRWIDHRAMYRQSGDAPLVLYWAPFWGARNEGEQLAARDSLALLGGLLSEAREWAGTRPIFIDQFNLIDNTPGHEQNAVLAADQIEPFLRGAVCVLKDHGVIGAALWTGRDYAESPLYNPSFAFGLEGWTLNDAEGRPRDAELALDRADDRDPWLVLMQGDVLAQGFGIERGRLPHRDDRPDQVCVDASSTTGARMVVRAGEGDITTLDWPAGHAGRVCASIDSHPVADRLELRIEAQSGKARLRGVWLFDHVQAGGLRELDGRPGPHIEAFRRFNAAMGRSERPLDCEV